MAAGARAMRAAADEVYGRCGEFRDALRALELAYVVIIPATTGSPSRQARSSALTRRYATRYSSGGRAGTGRKDPATATGRWPPPRIVLRKVAFHGRGAVRAART